MTTEQMRWIVEWVTETGSLLFMWHGDCGEQPVLMPGFTYYWWLDDSPLLKANEGDGGHRSGNVH